MYARGETGLDINPSAQHRLNCDLRGNHFRARLLLSSLASPEEFTWCNKDGVHYFTESRKQHIPQFCGSCWSLRSVSDRFQFARGEKGIDINPSVQHLLNCGGVRSCLGGSFSLCSSTPTIVSMGKCAFVSTANFTGRVVLAAPLRRSSPLAHPRSQQTTASELYYLRHQRSCACCSRGKGSGLHMPQSAAQSLFEVLGWSQGAEQQFIGITHLVRLYAHMAVRVGVRMARLLQRVHVTCPHFLVLLSALAYPQGGPRTQLTCLLVLAATLTGLHVRQPFCSAMSCAAAWSVLGEFHWSLRIVAAVCAWTWPAFPLDNEAPIGDERNATPAGPLAWQGGSRDQRSSRAPRSSRRGNAMDTDPGTVPHSSFPTALADTDDDMGEVPADTVMRGDAGPEDCVCCMEPLAGNRVVRWPQCGGVAHRFHALCTTAYQPMRRALSHLRVTGDSSRVTQVPCILCRSPWGSGPESVSELQHLCASLQDSGLPHGDCDCVACRADRDARRRSDMETDAPQPFMHHYGTDRAAVARAAFNELVTRARLADDAQAVVSAYTWSAMLVPFIWSAAADEDHAEWPSVIADLCGNNVDAGSGLSMGADSVRTCWVQLRAAFRTAGVDCMQDLCDHISRSEAPILAWASRDSRHSNMTPSTIRSRLVGLARGAYVDNFIQEWLLHSAEEAAGVPITATLGANLHCAAMTAVRMGMTSPARPQPVVAAEPPPVEAFPARQRRRRGDTGPSRVFCPVPGCLHGDVANSRGWATVQTMRNHLEAHRLGQFPGEIPQNWLLSHRLAPCSHCDRLVSGDPGAMHRSCRAEARPAGAPSPGFRANSSQSAVNLEAVLAADRPTIKHIPAKCKALWCAVLTRALSSAVLATTSNSGYGQEEQAWVELLCLPKAVLSQAPRAGRRHPKCQENFTMCMLQSWLDGDKERLIAAASRPADRRGRTSTGRSGRAKRCIELVEDGKDSQACQTLTSSGLAEDSQATFAALCSKHPQGFPVEPEFASAPALDCLIPAEEVRKCLQAFSKSSAPGPSGLRAQHLLDAVCGAEQGAALHALESVVNILASGKGPRSLSMHLAGASLVALAKENGDVRPIAVGEVLRRLTSKCLCSAVRSDAQRFFGSLQVGVACPLGLEAAIHTISQYCERNATSTSKIVMTIDFHNAFNSLDRNALLAACRRDFPTLAAWASWCYSVPSRLLYNERVVNSTAGVQQGDNLGPLLFATTIHSLLGELKAILGIDLVIGYLDDIVVAGDCEAVLRALLVLQRSIPSLGLTLNMAKCELIPLAGPLSTSDLSRFPAQMARVHSGRFKFLGAPVGDREFAASFVQDKRAAKADVLLTEISGIDDAQVTHKLLSRCMGTARVMHAMRTTRPDWMLGALEHVDKSMAVTAETCFGFAMPPSAEVQASLPVSLGGLGFRSARRHAAVAYLCSRVATRSLCEAMDPSFSWDVAVASGGGISEAIALCNQHLPADSALDVNTLPVLCVSQRALSRRVDEWTKTRLLSSGLTNAAERARMQAAGAPHAGAWLTALPSPSLGQRMTHPEFSTAAKVRLGLELLTADTWCPLCDEILDTRASHAMACMSGGDAVRLHNELRDAVFVKCMAAGIQGRREQAELLPDDPRRRPGDIYIPQWPGGQGIAMDFAVTSPLQIALVQAAAERPLAAARAYEERKFADRQTAQRCLNHGVRLVPMVAESTGGWGPEAQKAFKVIARSISSATGLPHGLAVAQMYESLSVKLMRAVARSTLARTSRAMAEASSLAASAAARELATQ